MFINLHVLIKVILGSHDLLSTNAYWRSFKCIDKTMQYNSGRIIT